MTCRLTFWGIALLGSGILYAVSLQLECTKVKQGIFSVLSWHSTLSQSWKVEVSMESIKPTVTAQRALAISLRPLRLCAC